MAKKHPSAVALDKWFQSEDGQKCSQGTTSGIYLQNRLSLAFMAGWEKCRKEMIKELKSL